MSNIENKFIVTEVGKYGITVKFEPKITTTAEIEQFMNMRFKGYINTWKTFGDLIYYYNDPRIENDEEDEEDEDTDSEED